MQTPFESVTRRLAAVEFAENPEPRVPCVLALDVSSSMDGAPIRELNAGLAQFVEALSADDLARKRADVAVLTFGGGVTMAQPFATADAISVNELVATGDTPMSEALIEAATLVVDRRKTLQSHGIVCYRPWVFLLTDGAPTDLERWREAVDRVIDGQRRKQFTLFPVGVGEGADLARLKELTPGDRVPLRLRGLEFGKFFLWLSTSVQSVSRSRAGDMVALTDPTRGPLGWGVAET